LRIGIDDGDDDDRCVFDEIRTAGEFMSDPWH